ncbi:hypothetical protein D0T53_02095 [Dysgonomonas sp. 216]|uniref:tetratricopeptide repeat protein n=1 Tax=Dysgonomonas sp. 216 TaxID=2302934 RepID=UPI0013D41A5E|nr:tetratricopeptide repeat protein [Dysgonomonas sp. 216]NDW17706.1 hypothetical protein [Dysgonomonas sp. 216]
MLRKIIHISLASFLLFFCVGEATLAQSGKVKLTTEEQRKFDYYFYDALIAKTAERYDEAFDLLNYCLQIDSTNATVLYELGNFYVSLDEKSKALDFYKKAVSYDPQNFYYNEALATMCLEFQKYTEAIDRYKYLTSVNPDKYELYLYLAEAYRLNGDFDNAIKALDNLEELVGMNEKISLQKFQLYSALDRKEEGYAEIQKYIDKYPEQIRYYILLGNIYLQDNKTTEAFDIYQKGQALDSDDPYLIAALANYYEKINNKEAAQKEMYSALLNRKLDIDTKLTILGQYVGVLQEKDGDTKEANILFDTLLVENPQEPKLNFMFGNLLMQQGKNSDAHFQFQIFAEANPTNPFAWEQLLKSVPNDSLDEQIKICETAISYLPEEPLFYFYLGVGHYQKKEYNSAMKSLREGAVLGEQVGNPMLLSEFHSLIGSLYHELDKKDSSYIEYEKALKYNPQNLGVLNNYSYFLAIEKKNLEKAEKMSSVTVKAEPTNPTYLDTYGWIMFVQGDYVTSKIYLQNAVKYSEEKEKETSSEVLEHYGDVLYKLNNQEEALEYWIKAKEKGDSDSTTLDRKIETKTYIAE